MATIEAGRPTVRRRTQAGRRTDASAAATAPSSPPCCGWPLPTSWSSRVQAVVSAAEAMYVGWLGAEALAGVALVFPLIMLMQTMSAGGMGGGVASAVARAVGAGRRARRRRARVARVRHRARDGRAVHARALLWPGPDALRRDGRHRRRPDRRRRVLAHRVRRRDRVLAVQPARPRSCAAPATCAAGARRPGRRRRSR